MIIKIHILVSLFNQSSNHLNFKMKTLVIYTITALTISLNTLITRWPLMQMQLNKCSCKINKLQ